MIQSVRLQHFRSYTDDSFEFQPGVNIIVGPNASGKTNLLEALLVVARGSSYRAHDMDLITHGEEWARLDASVDSNGRTVKLIREPTPEKLYELEGSVLRKLSLDRSLPVVLFEPNHLGLLTGPPEQRRDYLDDLITQTTAGYGTTSQAYRRTLAQRNRLLKGGHATAEHLFPWDVRLSELGARIVRARREIVISFAEKVGPLYMSLSQSGAVVSMEYHAAAEPTHYESVMLQQLEHRRHDDMARGFTTFGPHRDDLIIEFNGVIAEEVASRGETRTFVLCLKILELELLERVRGVTPLLLLDDVFSELDGSRRQSLTAHLKPYQTFITTTDADVVVHNFTTSHIIPISYNAAEPKPES